MNTGPSAQDTESDVNVAPLSRGFLDHVGSSMKPGATPELWLQTVWWSRIGKLACEVLTPTQLRGRVTGKVLGRDLDLPVKIELRSGGACTLAVAHQSDPDARYYLEHRSILIESRGFDGHAPAVRLWAEGAETKADVWVNYLGIRHKLHLSAAPPKAADDFEKLNQVMKSIAGT